MKAVVEVFDDNGKIAEITAYTNLDNEIKNQNRIELLPCVLTQTEFVRLYEIYRNIARCI